AAYEDSGGGASGGGGIGDAMDLAKWKLITSRTRKLKFGRSKMHGWGMFAEDIIEPAEFAIEYVGELIRTPLADARERMYQAPAVCQGVR
ncbi:hypothetical protein DUNSADRAFT_5802, partial [Dunaliella salina]